MTNQRFLRTALKLDAVASAAIAAASLLLAKPMEGWFGISPGFSMAIGVFLAVYAAVVWAVAARERLNVGLVWAIIIGNLGWVMASVIFAFGHEALTGLGLAYVIAQAAGVALFADLEFVGLRKAAA